MKQYLNILFLNIICVSLSVSASAVTRYAVTDLGTLTKDNSGSGYAISINNNGQVVGGVSGTSSIARRAFLWENGVITDLGTLRSDNKYDSGAFDINDTGQVVGGALHDVNLIAGSFLWQSGLMTDLGRLEYDNSAAFGINKSGQVVGMNFSDDSIIDGMILLSEGSLADLITINLRGHAFLWKNNVMTDLGTLRSGNRGSSLAVGINDGGIIVGAAENDSGGRHAFLWENGAMRDLGTLRGDDSGGSLAIRINKHDQVIGTADSDTGYKHAFIWDEVSGEMTSLGTLKSDNTGDSVALGINSSSQVVGSSLADTTLNRHAFIWENGVMVDLNNLLAISSWELVSANDINDNGDIVGDGRINGGASRAFLAVKMCSDSDNDGFSLEGGLCGPIDCEDNDPNIHPGAVDICDDKIDQDCSGTDLACVVTESTGTGTNVKVSAQNTEITFESITSGGETTVEILSEINTPTDNEVLGQAYGITTTAENSGKINICFKYSDYGLSSSTEDNLMVIYNDSGNWENVTSSQNTNDNIICGDVVTLSDSAKASKAKASEFAIVYAKGDVASNSVPSLNEWGILMLLGAILMFCKIKAAIPPKVIICDNILRGFLLKTS